MFDGSFGFIIFVLILLTVLISVIFYVIEAREKRIIREQIEGLANNSLELTPQEFFEMRTASFGGRGKPRYANQFNFPGIYILYNHSKGMYYVGQGKKVLDRVNNHFMGRGNGDIYADYKYGDEFTIKMIALSGSGFGNLNELESSTIETFDAYNQGYNKTRGNKK